MFCKLLKFDLESNGKEHMVLKWIVNKMQSYSGSSSGLGVGAWLSKWLNFYVCIDKKIEVQESFNLSKLDESKICTMSICGH